MGADRTIGAQGDARCALSRRTRPADHCRAEHARRRTSDWAITTSTLDSTLGDLDDPEPAVAGRGSKIAGPCHASTAEYRARRCSTHRNRRPSGTGTSAIAARSYRGDRRGSRPRTGPNVDGASTCRPRRSGIDREGLAQWPRPRQDLLAASAGGPWRRPTPPTRPLHGARRHTSAEPHPCRILCPLAPRRVEATPRRTPTDSRGGLQLAHLGLRERHQLNIFCSRSAASPKCKVQTRQPFTQ